MNSKYLLLVDDDDMALLKEVLGSELTEQLPERRTETAVHNEFWSYLTDAEPEDK